MRTGRPRKYVGVDLIARTAYCRNKDCEQVNPQPFSHFYLYKAPDLLDRRCKVCQAKRSLNTYFDNHEVRVVKQRERAAKKRKEDPSISRFNATQRKADVKRHTPPWVNKKELRAIYKNKPEGFDVDHMIPLKGKTVSGLNVPWNLQYLESNYNRKVKRNKLLPEYCLHEPLAPNS